MAKSNLRTARSFLWRAACTYLHYSPGSQQNQTVSGFAIAVLSQSFSPALDWDKDSSGTVSRRLVTGCFLNLQRSTSHLTRGFLRTVASAKTWKRPNHKWLPSFLPSRDKGTSLNTILM